MNLQTKIEEEIKKLETALEQNHIYVDIKRLENELAYRKEDLENNSTYQTLQTLKNLLQDTTNQDYKILKSNTYGVKGRKYSSPNKLEDTSHYPEMLDFIEAHLDLERSPYDITTLYNIILDAGYEVGGKKPAYTLSACLSRDPRFTPTTKGWILTKHVQTDNS